MTDEEKWLVAFGRGWIDRVDIEDSTDVIHSVYVRLAGSNQLEFNVGSNRIKLKEVNE